MFRIDNSTVAATQPGPTPVGTPGFFSDGSAVGGVPATIVSAEFLNGIQEELVNGVTDAGITLSKTTFNQLAMAIRSSCPPVGYARNAAMLVAAASATATFNADQVIVATSLSGRTFIVTPVALTCSLGSTGAGGMDTGSAPASGFVGIYLIYNPASGAKALLAVNAGPAVLPQVYGGANMPSGYTASALVSVWPTNASSQFVIGTQIDRTVSVTSAPVINTSTIQAAITALVTSAFPKNARAVSGNMSIFSTTASSMSLSLYAAGISVGQQVCGASVVSGQQQVSVIDKLNITVPQTVYYSSTSTAGTPTFGFSCTSYEF